MRKLNFGALLLLFLILPGACERLVDIWVCLVDFCVCLVDFLAWVVDICIQMVDFFGRLVDILNWRSS
ncbi:hypothetical protein, partial [Mesobacillus zeae]|uniref:hypothetical protein n=1 Tax=Mesobacillus zeae TaxID=1917180 RepID=UPI0039EEA26F